MNENEWRYMMKKQINNYNQFILGAVIFIIGIIIFAAIPNPVRYVGIILILLAIINIVYVIISKDIDTNDERYQSRIRNQILRHQYKK